MGAMLMWSPFDFSMFAFDLLAMISGKHDVAGRLSSFHALDFSKYPDYKNPGGG